jgi:hypothetical protein
MKATTQEMAAMDTSAISRADKLRGKKIGQSRMPNQTIQFPRRQRQHLAASRGRGHPMSLMLITWEAVKKRRAREQIFDQ